MAWDEEMPIIVRGLIQDWTDTPTYTDDQLTQIVLIASLTVQNDATFVEMYSVDVVNQTISPDYTVGDHRNESFINLASLKSACILIGAELRKYTGQGISIRDGSSAISLQRSPQSLSLLRSTYCDAYVDALYNYKIEGNNALGEAIVGPFKLFRGPSDCGYPLVDGGSTFSGPPGRDFQDDWY